MITRKREKINFSCHSVVIVSTLFFFLFAYVLFSVTHWLFYYESLFSFTFGNGSLLNCISEIGFKYIFPQWQYFIVLQIDKKRMSKQFPDIQRPRLRSRTWPVNWGNDSKGGIWPCHNTSVNIVPGNLFWKITVE